MAGEHPAGRGGHAGPVGLGFRVPALVISPFSRGGYVCSQLFDHTSLLRFIETRFGVEVPNLSPWRRSVTGDLTAAARPVPMARNTGIPALPPTSLGADQPRRAGGAQLAGRHAGPGHRLPAAHRQLHAVPGDQPAAAARAVAPLSHAGDGPG